MAREPKPATASLLDPLRSKHWLTEAQRKAIHLCFILLPLQVLHEWLPWPRGWGQWRLLLVSAVVVAIAVDLVRLHDRRARRLFGRSEERRVGKECRSGWSAYH